MKRIRQLGIIALALGLVWCLTPSPGYTYPVPPLPEDNLIINPWFRSTSDPTTAGLDGWTRVLQDGNGWWITQKASNPSPDVIISGKCGFDENYCGTGARWANDPDPGEQENFTFPGVDVYLYQVVNADPANRKLKYFMYWVNHRVDVAEIKIYGSDSTSGQWVEVWLPFSLSQDKNPSPENSPGRGNHPWFHTDTLETILGEGYPYYKIELHARYPEPDTRQGNVGVKITGVYFASEYTDESENLSTPVIVYNPTVSSFTSEANQPKPTDSPGETPEPGVEQETPHRVRTPSPTPQETISQLSPTPLPTVTQSGNNDLGEASGFAERSGIEAGFIIGFITAGLIVLAFLTIRMVRKKDRL
jgi:hypothetical protein